MTDGPRLCLVASLGALGALARYGVGLWSLRWAPGAPWLGAAMVNVLGCLACGVVVGLVGRGALGELWRLGLLTGFLGAFTTFSAFAADTWALFEERGVVAALANWLGQSVLSALLLVLGMSVAQVVAPR